VLGYLDASFSFNNEAKITSMTYPSTSGASGS